MAVATCTHPVEGDLDVVERPPSTGRDQRVHFAQGTRRIRQPVVGRLRIVCCLEPLAALVESGELFATEAELSLQYGAQHGKPDGQRLFPVSRPDRAGSAVGGGTWEIHTQLRSR